MRRRLSDLPHLAKAQPLPPAGYTPILHSTKGGYHKQVGGKWVTWYPTDKHARDALAHHQAQVDKGMAHAHEIATRGPAAATRDGVEAITELDHHHAMVEATQRFLAEGGAKKPQAPKGYKPIAGDRNHGHVGTNAEGRRELWYPSSDHAEQGRNTHTVAKQNAEHKLRTTTPGSAEHTAAQQAHAHATDILNLHREREAREPRRSAVEAVPAAPTRNAPHLPAAGHHPDAVEGARYQRKGDGYDVTYPSADHAKRALQFHHARVVDGMAHVREIATHGPTAATPASRQHVRNVLHHHQMAEGTKRFLREPAAMGKSTASPPPGFTPIPDSQHQGYHKQEGGRWVQWYPSRELATQARDHHLREAAGHAKDAREGGHYEAGRKHQERMAERHRALAKLAGGALVGNDVSDGRNTAPPGFEPVTYRTPTGGIATDPHGLHQRVSDGDTSFWSPSPADAAASARHHEQLAGHHADAAERASSPTAREGHDFAQDLHQDIADGARRLAAPMLKARATPAFARALLALFSGLVRGPGNVVTMSKGLPDQLIAADPSTIDVLDRWDEDGYTCQVRKAAGGAQYLTIEGGNLPIPYHAIVSDTTAARRTAQEAIPKFKRGRSPREGVYRRPGARRQGPRTGYAVYH